MSNVTVRRGAGIVHVEAPGCVVNVKYGLTDDRGRKVTAVEIRPDPYIGEEWHVADGASATVRVVEGKA